MVLEYILHIRQSVGSMIFGGHRGPGVYTAYKTERGVASSAPDSGWLLMRYKFNHIHSIVVSLQWYTRHRR